MISPTRYIRSGNHEAGLDVHLSLLEKTGYVIEEEAMFQYVQRKYPHWVSRYRHCLRRARQSVLHKLVVAFLRENIGGIINHLQNELPQKMTPPFPPSFRYYPVQNGHWLIFPIEQQFAFDRYQLMGDLLLLTPTSLRAIEHAVEWLVLVYPKLSKQLKNAQWGNLVKELCNAGANQALSYLWQERREEEMRQQGHVTNLLELVQSSHTTDPFFFEQFCVEGHHLHPCAKTKLGFVPEEVDQFSPRMSKPSISPFGRCSSGLCYEYMGGRRARDQCFSHGNVS